MKKTLFSITFILSSLFAFSQIPKDAVAFQDPNFGEYLKSRKIPTVKGKILNFPSEEASKIPISYTITTVTNERNKKTTTVNSDGSFSLELENNLPYQQIRLSIGKSKFYSEIYAHTDLFITIDWQKVKEKKISNNGDGVQYLGNDGELNAYLNDFFLFERSTNDEIRKALGKLNYPENKKMPHEKFIFKFDSLYALLEKNDSIFIAQKPSDYSWMIPNKRLSKYYQELFLRNSGHGFVDEKVWQNALKHKTYQVSNDCIEFNKMLYFKIYSKTISPLMGNSFKYILQTNEQKMTFDSLLTIYKNTPSQDSILKKVNQKKYNDYGNKNFKEAYETGFIYKKTISFLDSAFASSKNKADFLKLYSISRGNDIKIREKQLEITLASMKTDWCKDLLNLEYQNTLKKIKDVDDILAKSLKATTKNTIGELILETPFGAKLYEVKSGKGTELLANLKTTFEGKALLLDFWATWCGPCLSELPYSIKLHHETEDLPLEYVYLCTSSRSDVEKWKNKIAELGIPGTHIFVDEKIENELMDMFQASGFPSYRFIDKKGNYKSGAISRISQMYKDKLKKLMEEE